jgi:hypothetical protein
MARRRVIDSKAQPGDEPRQPASGSPLRPRRLDEYIGQSDL